MKVDFPTPVSPKSRRFMSPGVAWGSLNQLKKRFNILKVSEKVLEIVDTCHESSTSWYYILSKLTYQTWKSHMVRSCFFEVTLLINNLSFYYHKKGEHLKV